MKCPNCKGEVTEGKKFCGHCGLKLPPVPAFDDEAPTRLELPPVVAPVPVPLSDRPKPVFVEVSHPATAPKSGLIKQENPSRPIGISPWLAWIVIIIGWGIGGFLNFLGYGSQPLIGTIVTGLLWGLSLALALNLAGYIKGFASFLIVMVVWLLATMSIQPQYPFSPLWINGVLMIAGSLAGGFVTGLVVQRTQTSIRQKHILFTSLVWLIGSFFVVLLAAHGSYKPGFSFNFASGAIIGAVCGGLTLLVISRACSRC
jgi:hypothetical protein